MPEEDGKEPEVQEPKVPTAEEQLEALKAEQTKLSEEIKNREDSYKGLQRTLNQRDSDIKRLSDLHSRLDQLEETQKILAAMFSERGYSPGEEETPKNKVDYLHKFDEIAEKHKAQREEEASKAQRAEYAQQADEIWGRANKLSLPKGDRDKRDIYNYLRSGDIVMAREVLEALEETKEVKEPKETKETTPNEEEIFLKKAREKGLLKTDAAIPSGKSLGQEELMRMVAEGDMTPDEATKRGLKL